MEVIIKPTGLGLYVNTDLEPQMVQVRSHNSAIIYLDSQDTTFELNKADMNVSSKKTATGGEITLAQGIKRIKTVDGRINWVTPNINERNNTITFRTTNTDLTEFSVIIPEGFYSSPSVVMTAILTAMNSVSGTTGVTFTQTPVVGYIDKFDLIATGGMFLISPLCTAVKFGTQLYALPNMSSFVPSALVGSMFLYYTRYVDICSGRVNAYAKLQSYSSGYCLNIISRVYIDDPTKVHVVNFSPSTANQAINFNENDSISTLDIKLCDQFGRTLYVPNGGGPGNQSGLNWDMQLAVEY